MDGGKTITPLEEALAQVLSNVAPLGVEQVDLADALGRVLAEPLVAPHDLPPFDNSAMDGYALRAEDTLSASPDVPAVLSIVGESSAGGPYEGAVQPGECVVISTGAPMPVGADSVVPYEDVRVHEGNLLLESPIRKGTNVRPRGNDVRAGTPLFSTGTRLQVQHVGLLAALGLTPLPVYRRPRVAVLVTGSELLPYSAPLRPGAIRDSNSLTLRLWLGKYGVPCRFLGTVPDRLEEVEALLREALEEAQVVLVTGGVSVGKHDLVKPALERIGAETVFWRVNIKPGKPLLLSRLHDRVVFGLPGNPLAVVVGLLTFVLPYLAALEGEVRRYPPFMTARLETHISKTGLRAEFQTALLREQDGCLTVTPTPAQGSALVGALAQANAFIYLPAGNGEYPAGCRVNVLAILPPGGYGW